MNMLKMLAATSLLAASAAFAATAPAAAPTAAPAAPAAAAAAVPAAAPAKPDHHCRDEANEKHLKGAARAAFIKKCRADAQAK